MTRIGVICAAPECGLCLTSRAQIDGSGSLPAVGADSGCNGWRQMCWRGRAPASAGRGLGCATAGRADHAWNWAARHAGRNAWGRSAQCYASGSVAGWLRTSWSCWTR